MHLQQLDEATDVHKTSEAGRLREFLRTVEGRWFYSSCPRWLSC